MKRGPRSGPDPRQLSLDDYYVVPQPPAPTAGSLDYDAELRATLSQALKETPLSRAEVAAAMSDLTGAVVTEPMLNAWTAKSHDGHRFPFVYAAAFELATGSQCLQLLLARKRGALVLVGRQAIDAELGQIRRRLDELKAKERQLLRQSRSGL